MSDSLLTPKQAESLLMRVSSDDVFRALFESAPAKALLALGIPAETIVNLPASCLVPRTLASKSTLDELMQKYHDVTVNAAMSMSVPWVKMGSS